EINVMVPPGASPATYEPTVQQIRGLEHSPLYLKIGYVEFEAGWMSKIAASNPAMTIADLSQGIGLLSGDDPEISPPLFHTEEQDRQDPSGPGHEGHIHSGPDPHIWMSARNARIIARNTCDALISQFPEHTAVFNRRLGILMNKIDSVDMTISSILEPYKDRAFIIYHPALSYFARDYNLVQYTLEMEGKTPSPRHMQQMVDLGKEKKISAIFVQKQFDQRNATVLAEEIGARIIRIDPLSESWSSEMVGIAEQLKASFE
ncbi:MAG: metal ABC transporter solute-binding protein, Zn/Mn family, partial [Bacteroidales bacterium]